MFLRLGLFISANLSAYIVFIADVTGRCPLTMEKFAAFYLEWSRRRFGVEEITLEGSLFFHECNLLLPANQKSSHI